nr:MAG TPA: hypothetical protein [Bacteriophage sp.]
MAIFLHLKANYTPDGIIIFQHVENVLTDCLNIILKLMVEMKIWQYV